MYGQSFLEKALVDVGGPNSGDAEGHEKHAAESDAVRLHEQMAVAHEGWQIDASIAVWQRNIVVQIMQGEHPRI